MSNNINEVIEESIALAKDYFSEEILTEFKEDCLIWEEDNIISYLSKFRQSEGSLTLELSILSNSKIIDITYREHNKTRSIPKETTLLKIEDVTTFHIRRFDDSTELHFHSSSGRCLLNYSAHTEKEKNDLLSYAKELGKII